MEYTREVNNNDLDVANKKFEEESAQKKECFGSEVAPGKRPIEVDPEDALNEVESKIVKIDEENDDLEEDLETRIARIEEEKKKFGEEAC